jgi:hypothetical protein
MQRCFTACSVPLKAEQSGTKRNSSGTKAEHPGGMLYKKPTYFLFLIPPLFTLPTCGSAKKRYENMQIYAKIIRFLAFVVGNTQQKIPVKNGPTNFKGVGVF